MREQGGWRDVLDWLRTGEPVVGLLTNTDGADQHGAQKPAALLSWSLGEACPLDS